MPYLGKQNIQAGHQRGSGVSPQGRAVDGCVEERRVAAVEFLETESRHAFSGICDVSSWEVKTQHAGGERVLRRAGGGEVSNLTFSPQRN